MLSKNKEKSEDRKELDLNFENDRRVAREFEKELEPYESRVITVMHGTPYVRTLRGFHLFLHENGIFRYSEEYPLGAVAKHAEYALANMKHSALCKLRDRREWAANQIPHA